MRRAYALGALAALALSACGGGRSLSTSSLHADATAICMTAASKTSRIAPPRTPAGTARFLNRGIRVLAGELVQLRTLHASSDVADVYATAVKADSQKLSALRAAARAVKHGADPVSAVKLLQQRLAPIESAEDGAWQALEIPACLNR